MYRIWQLVHPMRALVALYAFLAVLAFSIHFILLSTERYNWLANQPDQKTSAFESPAKVLANPIHRIG